MSENQTLDFQKIFRESLVNWGGWPKLVSGDGQIFSEEISKTIASIAQHQKQSLPRIGKLTTEEWTPIAEALPLFLNAYLQQELNRILEPSGELLTALRLTEDKLTGLVLMALIITGREHHLNVEVSYKSPYSTNATQEVCHLSCGRGAATLTIAIAEEYGEEHLPLFLHYHGEDSIWDREASTPGNPIWVTIPVDRKGVVTVDGLDFGDVTLEQRNRDEFLKGQGFQPIRFSSLQLKHDLFGCASEAIKLITGKTLPPPSE